MESARVLIKVKRVPKFRATIRMSFIRILRRRRISLARILLPMPTRWSRHKMLMLIWKMEFRHVLLINGWVVATWL